MWTRERVLSLLSRRVRHDLMFPFIDYTWNPIVGCRSNCLYCWCRRLAERLKRDWRPRLIESRLRKRFPPNTVVFLCDYGDALGWWVPDEWISRVLDLCRRNPETLFLLLTKYPSRYLELELPENVIAGATIECDMDERTYNFFSAAEPPRRRIESMRKLDHPWKFISVEPIMEFSGGFADALLSTGALAFAVGYDNYWNMLPEPPMSRTLELIEKLSRRALVIKKTIRQAWWEIASTEHRLSLTEAEILRIVSRYRIVSISFIAKSLHTSYSEVRQHVDKLESLGLIKRRGSCVTLVRS